MPTPKLVYDIGTGMFLTREMSIRVTMDRVAWERNQKSERFSAPKPGNGLDGRPLQKGKPRADAP